MDINRHAVGLNKLISQDPSLKNAALRDIVILAYYDNKATPSFLLRHVDDVKKLHGDDEAKKILFKRIREGLGADEMSLFVEHYRSGLSPVIDVFQIATSATRIANADAHAITTLIPGISRVPTWARAPARIYEVEVPLSFRLDQIDYCLFDVHSNYRPRTRRGDTPSSSSSVTVLDYVERKIAARELLPGPVFSF